MTTVPSASTWGSPTATKNALLVHGLTSSSHAWHRVASSLVAQGYFVTAPNLVGHGFRAPPETSDYRISSIAKDLRPYLEARNYSLIIGHSVGGLVALSLVPHLPASHPTAIVLVDSYMQLAPEAVDYLDIECTDDCTNIKPAEAHAAEHPLWTREDTIYIELGSRMCSVEMAHGVWDQKRPAWNFWDLLDALPETWKVTLLVADPAINKLSISIKDIEPRPHVRAVMVPGAGHWIQYEFPEVVVEEALKTVAQLDTT